MANQRSFLQNLCLAFACLIFGAICLAPQPAKADWPSWNDFINKIAPLLGIDNDQRVAAIFALKHPLCASTIVSYTLEQDYSLVGMIGAMKVTKLQSLPKLVPLNGGNCKSYQPIQQAYQFIDRKGDDLLGKSKADYLRSLLASQIDEGKSYIDSEIAAIPYVGTILTNWDCECDAAFETDFKAEKLVDDIVGTIISVAKSIRDANYGAALETMISKFGPQLACKLAEEYSGVGSIPIVSDVASAACEKIAGKVVGFVVSAGSALAEAVGIIGGDHMPPEQYYAIHFEPELGKDGYKESAKWLYSNCYGYFEPSNMSADNAKKVCAILRDRYIVQSMGKIQWNDFQYERGAYYEKNVRPKALGATLVSDAEFKKIKEDVRATCKQYFVTQYPQANIYAAAYNSEPIETICDSFVSYSASSYHPWDMDKVRNNTQKYLTYEIASKTGYLCKTGIRNVIDCQDGPGMNTCTAALPAACKQSKSELGGMEIPCCQGGGKPDQSQQMFAEAAAKIAKDSGGDYCTTSPDNPLKITCTLKQTFESCQKHFSWENQRNCSPKDVSGIGQQTSICCSYDAAGLDKVGGVAIAKKFVETHKGDSSTGCSIGGYSADNLLTYDPRIISCGGADNKTTCNNVFGQKACKTSDAGLVEKVCCVSAVFGGATEYVDDYDPSKRNAEDLAKAQALGDSLKPGCVFGKGGDGKPDVFHLVCSTMPSVKACVEAVGKKVPERSKCNLTKSGYVSTICCSKDVSLFYGDMSKIRKMEQEQIDKGIKELKDNKGMLKIGNSASAYDGGMYQPDDKNKKPSTNINDLVKDVDKGGVKDKLTGAGIKPTDVLPKAKPKRAGGDSRSVSDKNNVLVDIRLLKVKPISGAVPFAVGDVKTKIDPANLDKGGTPKGTGKTLPGSSAPGAPAPANDDDAPPSSSPSMRGPAASGAGITGGANLRATSGGFNCSGRSNGNYCANATTLVTCTNDVQTNGTLCEGGCNAAARACNPYKP